MIKINGYKIDKIELNNYMSSDNTAIILYSEGEMFAVITTNLGLMLPINMAYLDTNNCPWVEDFMKKYNFGESTGIYGNSGFCEYPLYTLNIEELEKYK